MERDLLVLTVPGKPEPQGSVKAFVPTYKGGAPVRRPDGSIVVNLTSDNPALKAWRETVADAARDAGAVMLEGAVEVVANFYLQRPLAHMGTGRNEGVVKEWAPPFPTVRPDVDKLLRAILDALTGVAFEDDSQVAEATARKWYADPPVGPGVEIVVRPAEVRAPPAAPQMALV